MVSVWKVKVIRSVTLTLTSTLTLSWFIQKLYYYPQPVIDQVGTNSYSLVNWERLGVSSLSKAISQKPNRRASNPQPSDPESETLTTRPRTHQYWSSVATLINKGNSARDKANFEFIDLVYHKHF